MVTLDLGQRFATVMRRERLEALGLEAELQDPHDLRFVVDHQDAGSGGNRAVHPFP
jgi:hypothetical protein